MGNSKRREESRYILQHYGTAMSGDSTIINGSFIAIAYPKQTSPNGRWAAPTAREQQLAADLHLDIQRTNGRLIWTSQNCMSNARALVGYTTRRAREGTALGYSR